MNLNSFFISALRTVTGMVVGVLVVYLARLGISTDAGVLETLLFGLASSGYYLAVRAIETKFPKAGWLLLYPVPPVYAGTVKNPTPTVAIVDADAPPPPAVVNKSDLV